MAYVMNLTETLSLAFHSMAYLAERQGGRPSSAREIGEHFGATEPLVTKTLQRLLRTGLIRSSKGPGGGYVLVVPPEEITLLAIAEAVEGPLKSQGCALKGCNRPPCPVKGLVDAVTERVSQELASKTLAELVECFHGEEETATECTLKHRRRRKKAA